jgi:hypothetical protein
MTHPGLEAGFALDRLFRWLEGSMDGSKSSTGSIASRVQSRHCAEPIA